MFELFYKKTESFKKVYAVKNNKHGYPCFLIFENNQWKYVSAKHFSENATWDD